MISLESKTGYKLTGLVVLLVGVLFLLRDMGFNLIGETSGWTIFIVLLGAALLAGGEDHISGPVKRVSGKTK